MIPVQCFRGKKVALFGLGSSGLAAAAALVAGGARVVVWDDCPAAVEKARKQGFDVEDLHNIAWADRAALVLSPGVPLNHPHMHWSVALAVAHHVEVIGDIELFVRERNAFLQREGLAAQHCPFIAITGTNGKSTTTALVAHLLRSAGCDVQLGGNIGTAILSLEPPAQQRFYVVECSSYQIELTPSLDPTIGILLNLTPDHIDRHGSFEHYAAIKERLVSAAQTAILALDDAPCRAIYKRLKAEEKQQGKIVVPVATGQSLPDGYFAEGRNVFYARNGERQLLASAEGAPSLRGTHNMQNILAALACCAAAGIRLPHINAALASFRGLPHRMEEVGRKGHILFINDSKATNAEAAAPALAAFDHIYWIVGGVPKEGGIHGLQKFFPKIAKAYLIGEAAADFARTIGTAAPVSFAGTLANALSQAVQDATAAMAGDAPGRNGKNGKNMGDAVVLLSPACASFDQFANYGERGDTFRMLVQAL